MANIADLGSQLPLSQRALKLKTWLKEYMTFVYFACYGNTCTQTGIHVAWNRQLSYTDPPPQRLALHKVQPSDQNVFNTSEIL
jgi:hypothetical protein